MGRTASFALTTVIVLLLAACDLAAQPEGDASLSPQHQDGDLAIGQLLDDGHDDHLHRSEGPRDPSEALITHDAVAAAVEAAGVVSDGPNARITKNLALAGTGSRDVSGATTDVWAHDGYAYTGTFNEPCGGDPGAGVWVWDVHNPNRPSKVTVIDSPTGSRTNDVRVAAMNSGDVLVHSNEACATEGPGGFEIYDVDDPANPNHLASVRIDEINPISDALFGGITDVGVHNLFLFTQGEKDFVAVTAEGLFDNFQIFDITDPTDPDRVSAWGAEEHFDPGVGEEHSDVDRVLNAALWLLDGFGASQNRFLHDVTIAADGSRAYLANWDAGLVLLDISDPSDPDLVSVALDPEDGSLDGEVNSHSVWPSEDGSIVVEGEEDFSAWEGTVPPANLTFGTEDPPAPIPGTGIATEPGDDFETHPTGSSGTVQGSLVSVTSGALGGNDYPAVELAGNQPSFPASGVTGELVWIGRACDGDAILNADQVEAGYIAVVRRGACTFREKNFNAAAAGADAIVIANNVASTPWSGFRIWDYSDPANPVLASTFDTECSASTEPGGPCDPAGTYSSHNVIVETLGNQVLAYLSWYSDGMLVLDVTDPYHPVEVARYDNDPDDTDYWGVYKIPNEPWILGSDRNGGLDVFKTLGAGSIGRR